MNATLLPLSRPIGLLGLLACLLSAPAEGQGIFQRLENRLREQINNGPPPNPPAAPGTAVAKPPAFETEADPAGAATALPPPGAGRLGLVVEDPRPPQPGPSRRPARSRGALVVEVDPATPAAEAGFQSGDLIVAFDGRLIPDARTLIAQMRQTRPGQQIDLQFLREERLRRVRVTLAGDEPAGKGTSGEGTPDSRGTPAPGPAIQDGAAPLQPQGQRNSVLGELGSVLGGFLSGNAASQEAGGANAPPATTNPPPTPQAPATLADEPPPAADGATEGKRATAPDLPPSLATPGETAGGSSPTGLRQTIRRLEQRNRRLEDRLQQLENQVQQLLRQSAGGG
jgi:hypothetical protein